MMRALFSGVTGLKSHQTRMDVIGNNIANVNTLGFKKSAANFADLYSESISPASAPTANQGGVNAQQVGLGVSVNSIVIKHTPGAAEYTGNTLDLAIGGDGYFVLRTPGGENYTRAGNLSVSSNGSLVNPNGYFVQCYNSVYQQGDAGKTTSVGLDGKTTKVLNNFKWTQDDGSTQIQPSGSYTFKLQQDNTVTMYKNGIEMQSNLKVYDNDPTIGVTSFVAGKTYTIDTGFGKVTFEATSTTGAASTATGIDGKSTDVLKDFKWTENKTTILNAAQGDYKFTSNADGTVSMTLDGVAHGGPVNIREVGTAGPVTKFDMGKTYEIDTGFGIIQFTAKENATGADFTTALNDFGTLISSSNVNVINNQNYATEQFNKAMSDFGGILNNSSIELTNNDTFLAGNILGDMIIDKNLYENVTINSEGAVIAQLKNQGVPKFNDQNIAGAQLMGKGEKVVLGYVALANFSNKEGLEKIAENLYASTSNTGRATYSRAGEGGTGALTPSSLEMSNVDLSEEMVSMITTQRGFQANSRIITTTDSMLEELINLKR